MKMRMDGIEFEGSIDEMVAFARRFRGQKEPKTEVESHLPRRKRQRITGFANRKRFYRQHLGKTAGDFVREQYAQGATRDQVIKLLHEKLPNYRGKKRFIRMLVVNGESALYRNQSGSPFVKPVKIDGRKGHGFDYTMYLGTTARSYIASLKNSGKDYPEIKRILIEKLPKIPRMEKLIWGQIARCKMRLK